MLPKRVLTVLSCVLAGVIAAPAEVPPEKLQPTVIPIVAQSEELEPNGTFKFSYETGNGIIREETAYEKVLPRARDASSSDGGEDDDGDSNEIHVQRGSYSYTAPDGSVISVSYIADENGFQPIGSHLPRSPVLIPALSSAEKSGRALKVADSSESASVPAKAEVNGKSAQSNKGNGNTKLEDAPVEAPDLSKSVVADEAKPDEARTESIPASPTEKKNAESVLAPAINENKSSTAATDVGQEAKSDTDISTTEAAEPKSPMTEAEQSTAEVITTTTIASTSDASTATSTANVDLSTGVTSTEASAQSTTESEQASTALVDQASTSTPVTTTSAEVSEQPSSTLAPELASFRETGGPPTSTETINQSPTDGAQQSSTNAIEPTSTEQSISTTTA